MWRWRADDGAALVKFELLADLDDQRAGVTVLFDGCESLGAANLRGSVFAAHDIEVRQLRARVGGVEQTAEINVTGLAGFLLAKCAAAHSRRKPKDWYDIAYVLLHNDAGGVDQASQAVLDRFGPEIDAVRTALDDLAQLRRRLSPRCEGLREEMTFDHLGLDHRAALADAVTAVGDFYTTITS